MPIGIRIRDRLTGKITLDLTDRITREVGKVDTGTTNGFLDLPPFEGDIYFYCIQSALFPRYAPSVSLSGRRISWQFYGSQPASNRVSITIVYGAY